MNLLAVIAALIAFESGGKEFSIGRRGELGPLQTLPVVVEDVNRIYGTKYVPADCFDTTKASRICDLYLSYYASERRLGHKPTNLDAVRIWHGGPDGWRKKSTKAYADQIKGWIR